jgi:hypothetical protein
MKKILSALLFFYLISTQAYSQDQFRKYPIGASGCSAYFFSDPGQANVSFSPDSSTVYTIESQDTEGITYSIIVIDLSIELMEEEIEPMLISYVDYLKEQFGVTASVGYGKGHRLGSYDKARGVIDFWNTKEDDVAVKAWGDPNFLSVMMVFSERGKDVTNKSQAFFNGFRFPADTH